MPRLRDVLPRRVSDPLANVRTHVARRTGATDPVHERRKRRETERQPRVDPGLPSEIVDLGDNAAALLALIGHVPSVVVVTSTGRTVAAGATTVFTVACAGSRTVIGGGWLSDTPLIQVVENYPTGNSWRVTIYNPDVTVATNSIYAICLGS